MAGTTIQRVAAIGAESVWGTPVARTVKLMEIMSPPSIAPDMTLSRGRQQGSFAPAGSSAVNKAGATAQIPFRLTFEDLPFYLQNPFGVVSPGTSPYPRLYAAPDATKPVPHPYTLEVGDSGNIYTMPGALMSELTIKGDFDADDGDWTGQANFIGTKKAAVSASNEVQTVTVTGTPGGGTFKLSYLGVETSALAYNETAANVQTALRALSTIGAGNVTVTGVDGGPYTVTFISGLAGTDVALLVLSTNSLTGGSSPSVTIAESTRGGGATILANRTVEKIGMATTAVAVDVLGGTIGATAVTAAMISFQLKYTFGYHPKFFAGSIYAQNYGWGAWDTELTLNMEYTAAVKAWIDAMIAGTVVERLIRISATGSSSKAVSLDGGYTLMSPPEVGDRGGNTVIPVVFSGLNSPTPGFWSRASVSNAVASLAA